EFQVVIVSAIDPDTDIIGLPIDGYLTKSVSKEELLDAVDRALLKDRYEQLISEYNAVAETHDVLSEEYSQSELEAKDEFGDLEDRMESLQADIDAVVDDLGESSITNIFD
ncbi:MAG: HalX domain-containing protein, partial [Halonotius sp.]